MKKKFCFVTAFGRINLILTERYAQSLIKEGYEVYVIVSDDLPNEEKNGIHIISTGIKTSIGNYYERLVKTPKKVYKIAKDLNADVYQTSDIDYIRLLYRLKTKNNKLFFYLYENHPYTFYEKLKFPKFVIYSIVRATEHYMSYYLKKFNAVFTVADDIANNLIKLNISNVHVLGIYPLINSSFSLSYEEYSSREDRLLYFGAIYRISKQENVLRAIKDINIKYLLAGDFGIGKYQDYLSTLPEWNKVEFIGKFKHDDLPTLANQCTISNVLRDFQQLGCPNGSKGIIKLYESMALGLPLICSDVPLYREMMRKYPCGILVDINNENAICAAIKYLVEHKREAYEMGQWGRKAVEEEYSWDIESQKYIYVINNY